MLYFKDSLYKPETMYTKYSRGFCAALNIKMPPIAVKKSETPISTKNISIEISIKYIAKISAINAAPNTTHDLVKRVRCF